MSRKWSKEQRQAQEARMRSLWRDPNFRAKTSAAISKGSRRVDHEKILKDYESGLTMREVGKENDCNERTVQRILKEAGKSRGRGDWRHFKRGGWRELPRVGDSRLITIPRARLTEVGLDYRQTILAKWEVAGKNRLTLLLRTGEA